MQVELISKGYVRESICLCVVLVHLLAKSAGTWRMYINCWAMNNVMEKHCHPITRLDDMLHELYGSFILIKCI